MPLTATERRRLGVVRPELLGLLELLMDDAGQQLGYTLAVPEDGGTRTLERQAALYADSIAQGGGTLAYPVGQPGHSRHNYGAAFDVHIIAGGAGEDGNGADSDYRALAELGESIGLTAGYFFAVRNLGLKDPYHFQLNEPLSVSQGGWTVLVHQRTIVTGLAIVLGVLLLHRFAA